MLRSRHLNVVIKCRLRPLDLAKSSPSCLQRERYVSRCGAKRERKGKNVFRYPPPPARGRCAANEVYHRRCWLVLGARSCDFKARPISARDISPKSGGRSSGSWLSARRLYLQPWAVDVVQIINKIRHNLNGGKSTYPSTCWRSSSGTPSSRL